MKEWGRRWCRSPKYTLWFISLQFQQWFLLRTKAKSIFSRKISINFPILIVVCKHIFLFDTFRIFFLCLCSMVTWASIGSPFLNRWSAFRDSCSTNSFLTCINDIFCTISFYDKTILTSVYNRHWSGISSSNTIFKSFTFSFSLSSFPSRKSEGKKS